MKNLVTYDSNPNSTNYIFTKSIEMIPFRAELDKDVLKVSQELGKVPRSHKP